MKNWRAGLKENRKQKTAKKRTVKKVRASWDLIIIMKEEKSITKEDQEDLWYAEKKVNTVDSRGRWTQKEEISISKRLTIE